MRTALMGLKIGASLLAVWLTSQAQAHTVPAGQPGWQLVWSDEFNTDQLDRSKWQPEKSCWGGGNNERQCYTDRPTNIRVAGGLLHLIARQERFSGPDRPPENRRQAQPHGHPAVHLGQSPHPRNCQLALRQDRISRQAAQRPRHLASGMDDVGGRSLRCLAALG